MRIRTIDGPPLPAEIAEHAARAIALRRLLDRKITESTNPATSVRRVTRRHSMNRQPS